LSNFNRSCFSKEAVIVEARLLAVEDESRINETATAQNTNKSIDDMYGTVVGEVVVLTEVFLCCIMYNTHVILLFCSWNIVFTDNGLFFVFRLTEGI
jgi:hypothetical protein